MRPVVEAHYNTLSLARRLPASLDAFREMLLANLIMLGEIPAPTFSENKRIKFLQQRFTECGLQNCSIDEVGNGLAILPGSSSKKSILIAAHADTPFSANVNHTLSIHPDRVIGPGVADNSLGLAVLATLPTMMDRLGIRLRSDLIFMGATRSLGRGNLGGLRFFLTNNTIPIVAGISVEGVQFGRLNYASLASLDGEITCSVSKAELVEGRSSGAIVVLNQMIDGLLSMPLSTEPQMKLILGAVEGGTSFKKPARSALLKFQLLSESDEELAAFEKRILACIVEVSDKTRAEVKLSIIARSKSGGLDQDHLLVLQTRRILAALGVQPSVDHFSSSVSSFVERDIPAITIGISTGQNLNESDEEVAIDPMLKGIAQLIGILMAVDGGFSE